MKFLDQAGFSQSRLAHDHHQLTIALPRPLPGDFLIAANEWRKIALPCAASATARAYKPEQRHPVRHAFQFMAAALLGDKKTGDLALNLRCHDDAAGLCNSPARAPQC
jgi:hypothetical protein